MDWLDGKIDGFIRWVRDGGKFESIPICPGGEFAYTRWFIIPRNRWFNIYLHHFVKSDLEDLHDHRMANVSILLQGEYVEERFEWRPVVGDALPRLTWRRVRRLRPCFRLPSTPHRVMLYGANNPRPVWSLFIGGPHVRDWGFWDQDRVRGVARWTSHTKIVSNADPTSPGYGKPAT